MVKTPKESYVSVADKAFPGDHRTRDLGIKSVKAAAVISILFYFLNPFWFLQIIAQLLGAFMLVKVSLAMFNATYELFFMRQRDLQKRYGRGSWAVITGASDGIGLGIAHRLAMNGINLVLIARNEKKLQERVKEIKDAYKIDVEYRVADFSNGITTTFFTDLYDTMKNLDVSILVNNVGVGAPDIDLATVDNIFNQGIINMVPEFMMTKVFLDHFKSRSNQSAVIDISSMASWQEHANSGMYGATKTFNRAFSQCMQEKYGIDFGIDFLCIKPGFVLTNIGDGTGKTIRKLFDDKADGKMCITVENCAEGIVKCMGNVSESFGGRAHKIMGMIVDSIIYMSFSPQLTQLQRMFGLLK